jgi:site-specific recombinase XerD
VGRADTELPGYAERCDLRLGGGERRLLCFAITYDGRPQLLASSCLFSSPRGNRKLRGLYGPRALHNLVVEAGTSAGVAGRHFAHCWRHSYARSLVRWGEDIHVVQRLMGHSNIATTTTYFHPVDAYLLAAIPGELSSGSQTPRGR